MKKVDAKNYCVGKGLTQSLLIMRDHSRPVYTSKRTSDRSPPIVTAQENREITHVQT